MADETPQPKFVDGAGKALGGVAAGIAAINAQWGKSSPVVKFLISVVVLSCVFIAVWKTVASDKKDSSPSQIAVNSQPVTTIVNSPTFSQKIEQDRREEVVPRDAGSVVPPHSPPVYRARTRSNSATVKPPQQTKQTIINGPVIGPVGDHNQQEVTFVNARSGYLPPKVVEKRLDGDVWVTRVVFERSAGMWDPSSTTDLVVQFNRPYDSGGIAGGFGMVVAVMRELNSGEHAKRGLFAFTTTTAPVSSKVEALFRSRLPLDIVEAHYVPTASGSE